MQQTTPKYDCEYSAFADSELWPKIRQITIDLGLHHLFVPYEGMSGSWYFKVGGTIEQTNELSRRWASLEPKEEKSVKPFFFGKLKQLLLLGSLWLISTLKYRKRSRGMSK